MESLAQNLSWPRLSRLMLNEILIQYKKVLQGTAALIIVALFTAATFTLDASNNGESLPNVFLLFMLLSGGAIFTSMIFSDMHHPLERFHYLILPCSNLERFLSKFLLTGPLFIFYTIIATELTLLLTRAKATLFVDRDLIFYSISDAPWEFVVVSIMGCMIAHAVLFFGAIFFRKYALIKTIIGCFLLWLSTTIALLLSIKIFFWGNFDRLFSFQTNRPVLTNTGEFLGSWFVANVWFLVVLWLAIYLWILFVGYTQLKEHEV